MKRSTQIVSKLGFILSAVAFSAVVGPQLLAQSGISNPPAMQMADLTARYQTEYDRFRQERLNKRRVDGRELSLGPAESKALSRLEKALNDKNYQKADQLAGEAEAVVKGSDARYVLSTLQLQLAEGNGNTAMAAKATDALLAGSSVPAGAMPYLLMNQGAYAVASGDLPKAEAAYGKLAQLSPKNPEAFLMLAQTKLDLKKHREALELINRAVTVRKDAGQDVPQTWTSSARKIEAYLASSGNVSR